jgi:aryl-alcohol dehydrogenase-like predicted oxidoreductase
VRQLAKLAAELGQTLPELALAWCLRHAVVSSVIVGARTAAQIDENANASGRMLPESVLSKVDQILDGE